MSLMTPPTRPPSLLACPPPSRPPARPRQVYKRLAAAKAKGGAAGGEGLRSAALRVRIRHDACGPVWGHSADNTWSAIADPAEREAARAKSKVRAWCAKKQGVRERICAVECARARVCVRVCVCVCVGG